VGLVDEQEVILREIVKECGWGLARETAGEVTGVVFDAVAVAYGLDHLEVEAGALVNALGFDETALGFEFFFPPLHLFNDGRHGGGLAFGLDDVVGLGVDGEAGVLLADGAEEGVDLGEGVDLVAEEFDAVGVLVVGGIDLDDVAADAEGAATEVDVVAVVEDFNEAAGDVFALDVLPFFEEHQHAIVSFGRTETVDAGDGADDDSVAAFEEAASGGEAEFVQLFVDGGFFFYEEIAGGDVGFGLVVVVVGDEVFDGVVGEEGFELVVELGGEGLVVREDEGGALQLFDDLGHGEGLAGAGDAEEDLIFFSGVDTGDEFGDGSGLVALGLVGGGELEVHLCRIKAGNRE
jgi:hypothetical protein